jgi:DNA-directed RNA polymerase subunit H (RpoH/RPB5)
MVEDRGFEIVELSDLEKSIEDVEPFLKGKKTERAYDGRYNELILLPTKDEKLSVKTVRLAMELYDPSTSVVLLSIDPKTSFCKKEVDIMGCDNVQSMTYKNLFINPTRHHLVPKHIFVPDDDPVRSLCKSDEEWPKLPLNDPICTYYNFHKGSLIRIQRSDEEVYYRMVSS